MPGLKSFCYYYAVLSLLAALTVLAAGFASAGDEKKYSPLQAAIGLFDEYHVTYLDGCCFTSKDLAQQVRHFANFCAMTRNTSEKEEFSRILELDKEIKRKALTSQFLPEEEAARLMTWGVLTEKEFAQLEPRLFSECITTEQMFINFQAKGGKVPVSVSITGNPPQNIFILPGPPQKK